MNPKIKVVGVGGSGCNTIGRIARFGVQGIELIAVNTDAQALHFCKVEKKILIGKSLTKGLGAGMEATLGKKAAQENKKELEELLRGADMVFITCGLGGGTGSGASPVIAELAKNLGILTVGVVTVPFSFEGEQRRNIAKKAMEDLKGSVDSLLVISNDNLLKVIDQKTTVSNAFEICDDILKQAVQSITDVMMSPGIISIDFASVVSIMKNSGQALFAVASASGEGRAKEAATKAIHSPLLDFSIKGSRGILINAAGADITLLEIQEAAKIITEHVDSRAQIIFGAVRDTTLKKGEIKITVIATKF
jgi:cell division protein FtsZ